MIKVKDILKYKVLFEKLSANPVNVKKDYYCCMCDKHLEECDVYYDNYTTDHWPRCKHCNNKVTYNYTRDDV